jgi:hypothetical protein
MDDIRYAFALLFAVLAVVLLGFLIDIASADTYMMTVKGTFGSTLEGYDASSYYWVGDTAIINLGGNK